MKWLGGGSLPGFREDGRSNGRVQDRAKRKANDRVSSNEGRRGNKIKTSSTLLFHRSKSINTPLRGGGERERVGGGGD